MPKSALEVNPLGGPIVLRGVTLLPTPPIQKLWARDVIFFYENVDRVRSTVGKSIELRDRIRSTLPYVVPGPPPGQPYNRSLQHLCSDVERVRDKDVRKHPQRCLDLALDIQSRFFDGIGRVGFKMVTGVWIPPSSELFR